jgi:UDP-N-acetylglucosamine:LPS N-acetylglucosamine transferase
VRVLGFTQRMRDLLARADAFVSTTAGTSCIEARLCGCPTVCYGFTIGHVRDNTAALQRLGLARVARRRDELARAIEQALAEGRHQRPDVRELPSAAELTVELARRGSLAHRSEQIPL